MMLSLLKIPLPLDGSSEPESQTSSGAIPGCACGEGPLFVLAGVTWFGDLFGPN